MFLSTMQFEQSQFRAVLRKVRDHFEMGAQHVFFIDGVLSKRDLHFTYDAIDEQMLFHENQYEAHLYRAWDVRSFYEKLCLIDKGKLPRDQYILSNLNSITMGPVDYVEGQLKRVGMADELTPELKEKITHATGAVQHTFARSLGSDEVDVTLNFRKSRTSDMVFLNNYEMTLKRGGETIKQTFYNPPETKTVNSPEGPAVRHDNKWTFKEAYNLLAGRPVSKNLLARDGEPYQAWIKMDKEKVLANGNHELRQFNKNYGFDLEKVLKNYSIKDLGNPQYHQRMVESLHRGNPTKVTFVNKEGREEPFFISPSINTSSLNVFDSSFKRVPLERLVQEGYISEGLVNTLKEKFGHRNTQGPTNVGQTSPVPKSEVDEARQKQQEKKAKKTEVSEEKDEGKNKRHKKNMKIG